MNPRKIWVTALCVTHDRPEFMPWLFHQFTKQTRVAMAHLIVVDSSKKPVRCYDPRITVIHAPRLPDISKKRTLALAQAKTEYVSWFDDDDWQSPYKLEQLDILQRNKSLDACGARHGSMYSTLLGKVRPYESIYEPIIFNSAVYRRARMPQTFDPSRLTGEDTDWHERWLRGRPAYVTLGSAQHAWLCHQKNITNKSSSAFFENDNNVQLNLWEEDFLKRLPSGDAHWEGAIRPAKKAKRKKK